jgi:hypothetical protein
LEVEEDEEEEEEEEEEEKEKEKEETNKQGGGVGERRRGAKTEDGSETTCTLSRAKNVPTWRSRQHKFGQG